MTASMTLPAYAADCPLSIAVAGPPSTNSELFGIDRLEEHARSLASAQPIAAKGVGKLGLSDRLAENAAVLLDANPAPALERRGRQEPTPAAEWLVDNYHLVEVQIREIGIERQTGYYAQLPKLADGPFTGLPRVFSTMWPLVAERSSLWAASVLVIKIVLAILLCDWGRWLASLECQLLRSHSGHADQ